MGARLSRLGSAHCLDTLKSCQIRNGLSSPQQADGPPVAREEEKGYDQSPIFPSKQVGVGRVNISSTRYRPMSGST